MTAVVNVIKRSPDVRRKNRDEKEDQTVSSETRCWFNEETNPGCNLKNSRYENQFSGARNPCWQEHPHPISLGEMWPPESFTPRRVLRRRGGPRL